MNFGSALEKMKSGEKIARTGWNGKGMFVFIVKESIHGNLGGIAEVKHNPYMAIKNVNGAISTWVPSVNDCLAEDWYIIENESQKPDYVYRMESELRELKDKIQKLDAFLDKTLENNMENVDRVNLLIQSNYMKCYADILHKRLMTEYKKINK